MSRASCERKDLPHLEVQWMSPYKPNQLLRHRDLDSHPDPETYIVLVRLDVLAILLDSLVSNPTDLADADPRLY